MHSRTHIFYSLHRLYNAFITVLYAYHSNLASHFALTSLSASPSVEQTLETAVSTQHSESAFTAFMCLDTNGPISLHFDVVAIS